MIFGQIFVEGAKRPVQEIAFVRLADARRWADQQRETVKRNGSTHGVRLVSATGRRTPDGTCSDCGGAGFSYDNGAHVSVDGVRGYRCMTCGSIKGEP